MGFNRIVKTIEQTDGQIISIETGHLARQADGAVVLKMGNTMVLATVVSAKEPCKDADFFPLFVDYQEKFAACGRIPGGFLKREGKLGDHEVLTSRLIDRAIRPLFPEDYFHETQVNVSLISADQQVLPDALVALASSSALAVSDVPFQEHISEVRVVLHKGSYKVNPNQETIDGATLNMIVAGTSKNILMVEGEMKEASEEEMIEAIKVAHQVIKTHCTVQGELAKELGVEKRAYTPLIQENEDLKKEINDAVYAEMYQVVGQQIKNKKARKEALNAIKEVYWATLAEEEKENKEKYTLIKKYLNLAEKCACRNFVLNENIRMDGRKTDEVRPISSVIDYLPSAHGSAVFTRGETQSLTSLTLGTKLDEQIIDRAMVQGTNRFLLHYNFPAFSTGEVKPNRGPGRREIGHGNLAHRALAGLLPSHEENPYTIRIVSDILESNGSSSMATVCAGSLALMDAGIKIRSGVSGIAMGMISDAETGKYAILSDILGDEDHLGDMDFKVTGTSKGITACQMDIKIDGLSYEILQEALNQAKKGRIHILEEMQKTIAAPRENLKAHAPRFEVIKIQKDYIRSVIGPGGKVVQEIQKETGTTITIEEKNDFGLVSIFGFNKDSLSRAYQIVKDIVAVPEVGKIYRGVVKSITAFGAFVEFLKGKEGLLHISEISWSRHENMDGVLQEGEEVKVKLVDIDSRSGKFRLSRKVLLPRPDNMAAPKKKFRRPPHSGEK